MKEKKQKRKKQSLVQRESIASLMWLNKQAWIEEENPLKKWIQSGRQTLQELDRKKCSIYYRSNLSPHKSKELR